MHERTYTTGEIAERLNITRRTLHFYEEIGLVKPHLKGSGGQRLYSEEQVRQISFVTHLKDLGMSLKVIGELLEVRTRYVNRPKEAAVSVNLFIDEALLLVRERIQQMTQLENDLLLSREVLRNCCGCRLTANPCECQKCEVMSCRPVVPETLQAIWLPTN